MKLEKLPNFQFVFCQRPKNRIIDRNLCFFIEKRKYKNIDGSTYEECILYDFQTNKEFSINLNLHSIFNQDWQHQMDNFLCLVEQVL